MADGLPLRGRWAVDELMSDATVNAWIAYNKELSKRSYDQMIESLTAAKYTYTAGNVAKNLDLIIARLRVLSRNEKIDKVNTGRATTLAVRDVFEQKTGQTGDPKLSSVKKILDYTGIKTAGKKRTLKKRKQKKRTAKKRLH